MPVLDLTIDDIGDLGDGIAHHNSTTLFVAGALTGESVRVELKDESKNLVKRCQLLEVLNASTWRTKPPCPHFGTCGGCKLQHMNDDAYTTFKLSRLQSTLLAAGLTPPPFSAPVITALKTRRRARFAVKHTSKGVIAGFNQWRSHMIVDLKGCQVLKDNITNLLVPLRQMLSAWLPRGDSCDIQITSLPDGLDILIIGGPPPGLAQRQVLADIAQRLKIAHLSWKKWDRAPAEPIVHISPLGITFGTNRVPFPPGAFLQATDAGEQAMVNFACEAHHPDDKVLDLFCGLGTFGLSLSAGQKVHFCDLDGPSVDSLEKLCRKTGRHEVSLRNLLNNPFTAQECNDYDLVIFDPPRGGAKAQAAQLAQSKVAKIVAVSCDPNSFARDAKILTAGGYVMKALLPIDQFLWSTHMECAALFMRQDS